MHTKQKMLHCVWQKQGKGKGKEMEEEKGEERKEKRKKIHEVVLVWKIEMEENIVYWWVLRIKYSSMKFMHFLLKIIFVGLFQNIIMTIF